MQIGWMDDKHDDDGIDYKDKHFSRIRVLNSWATRLWSSGLSPKRGFAPASQRAMIAALLLLSAALKRGERRKLSNMLTQAPISIKVLTTPSLVVAA